MPIPGTRKRDRLLENLGAADAVFGGAEAAEADAALNSMDMSAVYGGTTDEVKMDATEVYARWGLSLNDAINTFLVKSIEVGGLPFDLRPEAPSYEAIAAVAYKPELNDEDVAVLPAEWDDEL